jgi:hypothetical protein
LDEELNFLWFAMNENREKQAKPKIKAYQKIIYVFEYMKANRSWIDPLGPSKSYLPPKSYASLGQARRDFEQSKMVNYFFDLTDVIALKMVINDQQENDQEELTVYFVDKQTAYNEMGIRQKEAISQLTFNSASQFDNSSLLADRLKANFITYKTKTLDSFQLICLRNVYLKSFQQTEVSRLNCNIYSAVSLRDVDEFPQRVEYRMQDERGLVQTFLNAQFIRLNKLVNLNETRFVRVEGKIINICDETSSFEFVCPHCATLEVAARENQLIFDNMNRLVHCFMCFLVF